MKNANNKKRKNQNLEKKKKEFFFLISQGSFNPKIPRSKGVLCSPCAERHTDTKVNTEDTLSAFQEYFLQPIIKDRSNNCMTCILQTDRHTNRQIHTETQNCEPLFWETLPSGYDQGAVQYICN